MHLVCVWLVFHQEEMQEDFGWKLVHGDVFRPPTSPMLLSVIVGSGVQLFCMTFITLGEWFWPLLTISSM